MRMGVRCLALVFLVLGPVCVSANFYGDAYYNDRYGTEGIDYTTGLVILLLPSKHINSEYCCISVDALRVM